MDNPFQRISDVFQPDYYVNFSIEKPDGTIRLTITDAAGVVVRRCIGATQWRDQQELEHLITSLQTCLDQERRRVAEGYAGDLSPLKSGRLKPGQSLCTGYRLGATRHTQLGIDAPRMRFDSVQ